MAHGDAVINGNGVEFGCETTLAFNDLSDLLPDFMQVHVSGDKLRERIGDGDDRLSHLVFAHAIGAPKAARARHTSSFYGSGTPEFGGHNLPFHWLHSSK
jgi:hypothetical protein